MNNTRSRLLPYAVAMLALVGSAQVLGLPATAREAAGQVALPNYDVQAVCARSRSPRDAADCLATELAFKWAMSRLWPALVGPEKDQAEICVRTIAYTLPDTGSFRALAECASGVSNASE